MKSAVRQPIAIAAACAAVVSLLPIAFRQLKLIKHLPDPASNVFDSDRIVASSSGYPLGIPDSLLGMGSYGASLFLLLNARRCGHWRTAAQLKLLGDGAIAAFNSGRQIVVFRKLCSWCLLTVAATAIMVPAGLRALRLQRP